MTVTVTPAAEEQPSTAVPTGRFPRGFSKVVRVTSLPFQVRSRYQDQGQKKAVAIAPGVWAPLPIGSSMHERLLIATTGTR